MSKNLLNKYVWLVETIYNAKYISFEEINRRWLDDDISEGVEISKRTFHTWLNEAQEMFGLVILCERKGGYHYYIENAEEIRQGGLRNWLLNTISTSNLLMENKQLKDRILLEEVPSVKDHLSPILKAMKADTTLMVTYQSIVVVDEVVATSRRHGMELMVGQQFPEMFARGATSAIKLIVGVIHLVAAHHGFQATLIERAVVRHQG